LSWIRERSAFIVFSALAGSLLILFLLGPLVSTLASSSPEIPGALGDARIVEAITTSVICALAATLLTLATGVPLAYVLTRVDFRGRRIIDGLLDLPILIPHNAAGIALLFFFSSKSPLGGALGSAGLSLVDTVLGIVAAMAFVSAPFMVRSAQEAFRSVDPSLEQVARSLGASQAEALVYVTLPLSGRGILTGCVLTWARAVSEFGAVVVLAYYPKTAPVLLFDVLIGEGLQRATPITGILILIGVLVFTLSRALQGGPRRE